MNQRGKKGQTVRNMAVVEAIPRQPPPVGISAREAELWMQVINTKPADWFGSDTIPLLRSYVRHCYQSEKIDYEMDKIIDRDFTPDIVVEFETLQKMRERESAKIMALARSMRLTQQAQIHPEKAGTKTRNTSERKPWQG
jgi:hypothetical protein